MTSIHLLKGLMITMSMILISCGKQEREPVLDLGIFVPYVEKFQAGAQYHGGNLKVEDLVIQFGPMDNPRQRAICDIGPDSPPTIIILESGWELMDENERTALMFHEMGHCVLRRPHVNSVTRSGLPASLMNPYLISGHVYSRYEDYYNKELFKGQVPSAP